MDNAINTVTIPRAPKLPSDLATLVAFDGSDRVAFNAFACAVERAELAKCVGELATLPAVTTATVPARRI